MSDQPGAVIGKPPPYSERTPGVGDGHGGVGYTADMPPPYYNSGPVPPPAGWSSQSMPMPPPAPNYGTYGATSIIMSEPVVFPATQVIIVGGCPACRIGILEDNFSCLGLLCAIVFFPIGILCCLALRDKRCTNCGAIF